MDYKNLLDLKEVDAVIISTPWTWHAKMATNALELVIKNYFENTKELQSSLQEVKKYHNEILLDLYDNENQLVFKKVTSLFDELNSFFKTQCLLINLSVRITDS